MMPLSLTQLLMFLSAFFVFAGFFAILRYRRHFLRCLMGIQLAFAAPVVSVCVHAARRGDGDGALFGVFALCIGALYAAVGLAVYLLYFRKHLSPDDEKRS